VKREERRARTRAELLDAAARIFAQRGYHGASMHEIAADAGLTTGAIYANFANKEALFLALADQQVTQRRAEISSILDQPMTAASVATEGAARFVAFLDHEPDWPLLYFEFWAYGVRNPELRDEFTPRRRAVQEVIAKVIQRAADALDLELPYPAEQLAVGVSAAINGLAFERVADPGVVPDQVFAHIVSALMTGIFSTATPRGGRPRQGSG